MNISVVILTLNEASDLPGCLDSVMWSNDVHVLDSGSTDATCDLARSRGAHVWSRAFDNYAAQRNYSLTLPFKNSWVFVLDADERVPVGLDVKLQHAVATAAQSVSALRLARRDYWGDRWLKHAQISPFYIRVLRLGRATYERSINETVSVDGEIVDLDHYFVHYPFSKGIGHWLSKHNVYSTMEAKLICDGVRVTASLRTALFNPDFSIRRIHQKALFYRLPLRPVIKFFYMLFVRRAVLDGAVGVRYSILQAFYEYMIVLKEREYISSRGK